MLVQRHYEELARQLSAIGAVKRDLARTLPQDCPDGSAAVLTLLGRYGEMRMSRLAELLAVDMSVTSRHVAHVADRGWVDRSSDPTDKRSRIVRITPEGERQLKELSESSAQLLAHRLRGWSDNDVAQLTVLISRLRSSFGDCRSVLRCSRPTEQTTRAPA
ncbi:MarR family transcriptional regulator [Streptomyces sp. NPDC002215]|uniref:MarR family winged helix-turn-helix transcriptional regulator n=1 Tax=Streptomyces sp. NPDC002215 TaxID=3154412 RepID=UPI00332BD7AB